MLSNDYYEARTIELERVLEGILEHVESSDKGYLIETVGQHGVVELSEVVPSLAAVLDEVQNLLYEEEDEDGEWN